MSHSIVRNLFRPLSVVMLLSTLVLAQQWNLAIPWGSNTPFVRGGAPLVHDPVLGHTVMFGGFSTWTGGAPLGTFYVLDETWQHDGQGWRLLPAAVRPSPRADHGFAFDRQRRRAVLFGGVWSNGFFGTALADTWEFDGVTWQQILTPQAPAARYRGAMAYDSSRRRVVLFGGQGNSGHLADTWEYDGLSWAQLAPPASPTARHGGAMTDTARGHVLLFGGHDVSGLLADTWTFDGLTWQLVSTPAAPSARERALLAFDPLRARAMLVGGLAASSALSEAWEFDGTTWTQIASLPSSVPYFAPMTHDLARRRLLLFAHDTWELQQPAVPTFAHYGHGCPGANGTPSLDAAPGAVPALGTTFTLQLGAMPAGGVGFLGLGTDIVRWGGVLLPAELAAFGLPGCQLWMAPVDWLVFAASRIPFNIPSQPILAGMTVATQALVLDPLAPGGAAVSNAGLLTLH